MAVMVSDSELALLHQKIDYLTEQIDAQRRRQEEIDELKQDLIPVVNHMIKLSIDELAEIGTDFQVEDLFFLLKRLLRDTHLLLDLLDRLEAMADLFDEAQRLIKPVFNKFVEKLDVMEGEGYFTFTNQSWRILERIVTEFSEEDLEALGDNIVNILTTVRNLTQPEILALTNKALSAIQEEPPEGEDPSALALLRALFDPEVRKGMARMLNLVKVLAEQPTNISQN